MKRIIALVVTACMSAASVPAQTGAVRYGIFRQEGMASWYGPEFAGRSTASGEAYNPGLLTAAHPALPFGTMLRVTNRHNNRQVTVRINDRGPFVPSRIIDLSQAAAEQLDMIQTGTVPVLIESVNQIALPVEAQGQAAARAEAPYFDPNLGGTVLTPLDGSAPLISRAEPSYAPAQTPQYYPPASPAAPGSLATQGYQIIPGPLIVYPPLPTQTYVPPANQMIAPPAPVYQAPAAAPPAAVNQGAGRMEPVQQIETSPQVQPLPPAAPVQQQAAPPQQQTAPIQPAPRAAPVQPETPAPVPQTAPVPQAVPVPEAAPQAAVVRPAIPPAGTGKTYRIQAGSYRTPRNAVDAFDRIKSTGLSPAYERNGEYYRVVLPALRPEEVPGIAEKLGAAGFREVIIREE